MLSGIKQRLAEKVAPLPPCECFDCSCEVLPIPRKGYYDSEEIAFLPVTVAEAPLVCRPTIGWLSPSDFQLPFGSTADCKLNDLFTGADYKKFFRFSADDLLLPAPIVRRIDLSKVILAEGRCRVSHNLLRQIRGVQVAGKCYGERPSPPLEEPKSRVPTKTPRNHGYRASFIRTKVGSVIRRQEVSLWELLLPVLQKPVNLDRLEQSDLPAPLWHFQMAGIDFLVEKKAALLGDDMGTGKTVQTAVAMRVLFQKMAITSALIVCPLSVLRGWDRELEKWSPSLCVTVVRGSKEFRKLCWRQPTHVWLTTFDTLRNDINTVLSSHPKGFGLAVVDEAQRIKNPSTGYSRAVRQIDATYRWALSGTPLENSLEDVFGVFAFVKKGLVPPSYTARKVNELIRPYFLRRRKQDVLKDLPKLVERPVWLRLEGEQLRSYEQLEKKGVLELHRKGETITAQSILVLLGKLKQVCNRCPASDESAKLEWLKDNLEDIVAEGDKCLVFTQYRQKEFGGTDWLEERLPEKYGPLNYGKASTDNARATILRKFKDPKKHSVFLAHPKTAGVGLNELVVANYVIHFDHWWNPATTHQATARAHRPGQTKKVFAYHLWVEDTVEERIFRQIEGKQRLYAEVIDSLSVGLNEEMLFAVYDELLAKYGLKVSGGAKAAWGKRLPDSAARPSEPSHDHGGESSSMNAPDDSQIPSRETWGNDPISTRQIAVLKHFQLTADRSMTKGQAADIIDKLFAVPAKKQSWETAKSSKMASFKGTPLYEFILKTRDEHAEKVDDETLDEALEYIGDERDQWIREIEEMLNRPCPKCNYVIRNGASLCPKCGHYSEVD